MIPPPFPAPAPDAALVRFPLQGCREARYWPPVKIIILSCSLNEDSKSRALARKLLEYWEATAGGTAEMIDLRDGELPLCDGGAAYGHPAVQELGQSLAEADAVVLAVPIYNFDMNSAAKNAIELAGRQLEDKVAGFMCSAGGQKSYMSVMAVASSLMLDFRTIILPRFVYATGEDFEGDGSLSPDMQARVEQFGDDFLKLASAVTAMG